ncbi:[Fe-Fe] hydrogenase large subunit C-terminal domain-containing protein [Fusibacter bizertensis]|uniref:[Fe-Fe] hydrogenase large subunit C-terminal domain-containing protein n=1 Tax=Fusibacter bizertensis TaxID=1488331 RepID=A0ABT6NB76_9FIRM|nr:[Fe-Fe] hydrogenase large subunit C-terminal domain-containing protein [Fusibacter bizertensis]MDH8677675.1 [Fe-Fe] hydrogenase large subunit C-terminal domain-containing protein [Fusibacter bizertensis]
MKEYWHSVVLEKDYCNGCTHCLDRCPTQAIRIIDGKARIIQDRCIDCGECLRVCPYHAKGALVSSLDVVKNYRYTVAIPSISFYGQFPEEYEMNTVYNALLDLGFDEVYDTAHAAELLAVYENHLLDKAHVNKPLISTYCPVITRLIQIKYPALIEHIIKLEAPMEIAARHVRKRLISEGYLDEEIGIIYISPCPAKVTSIKNPIGIGKSSIDEAVSTEEIYYKVMKIIDKVIPKVSIQRSTGKGIGWARVGGQSYAMDIDDYIAVDGIDEVIKVLESMEIGKLNSLEFFEGYACVNGCVGGPLNVENTFIGKNRVRKLTKKYGMDRTVDIDIELSPETMEWDTPIQPMPIFKLDTDFKRALEKMAKIEEYTQMLPGINCGACGSPNCRVLAEDIVNGYAKLEDCLLLNKR